MRDLSKKDLESISNSILGLYAMWRIGINIRMRISDPTYSKAIHALKPYGIDVTKPPGDLANWRY